MKRTILIVVMLAGCSSLFGQGLKLTAFGGYTIQDKVYGYYGDVIIEDGPHYGGMLSYERNANMSIDLTYSHQSATYNVKDYTAGVGSSGNYSGAVNYIMIGTSHSKDFTAKVAPYGGGMLGAAIFTSSRFSDEWKFAVGGKLGVIVNANEKIGIMIQTQLMVPVQGVGLGVGCGTSGCGGGTYTSSTATQLGFTGGVQIKLNN